MPYKKLIIRSYTGQLETKTRRLDILQMDLLQWTQNLFSHDTTIRMSVLSLSRLPESSSSRGARLLLMRGRWWGVMGVTTGRRSA